MHNFLKSLFWAFLFTVWGMSLYLPFMYFYTLFTRGDLHRFYTGIPGVALWTLFLFTFIFEFLHARVDQINAEGQKRLKKHNQQMFGEIDHENQKDRLNHDDKQEPPDN